MCFGKGGHRFKLFFNLFLNQQEFYDPNYCPWWALKNYLWVSYSTYWTSLKLQSKVPIRFWDLEMNLLEILLETWRSPIILTTHTYWPVPCFLNATGILPLMGYLFALFLWTQQTILTNLNSFYLCLFCPTPTIGADTVRMWDKGDGQPEKANIWSKSRLSGSSSEVWTWETGQGLQFAGRHKTGDKSPGKEAWCSEKKEHGPFSQADLSLNLYLIHDQTQVT